MSLPLSRAAVVRIIPFALFIVLLAVRGALPEDGGIDPRWVYGWSVLLVGGLLMWFWREYGELVAQTLPTFKEAALAVAAGAAVLVVWINLDSPWMRLGEATSGFRPVDSQGNLMWPLVALRWVGAALLVPVMESFCRPSRSRSPIPFGSPPSWPGWPTRCYTFAPASFGCR
jgi:uncharacterized protein